VKIQVVLPPEIEQPLRQLAADKRSTLAGVAREAILAHIKAEEAKAFAPPEKPESLSKRQERFLAAVEKYFTPIRACKRTKISRSEVAKWLEDPTFEDRFSDAQEAFVEFVEWKLLDLGKRGAILALLSFLNAHHPKYGRLRYEAVIRFLGPLLERIYNEIRSELGEQGETLCGKIRELADKALSSLSD